MPVKLKIDVDEEAIRGAILQATEMQLAKAIQVLQYVGEMCVNEARENGSYKDQTGNLRSSTGYVVVRDGVIVNDGGFIEVLSTASVGPENGRQLATDLAGQVGKDKIALIVVAGMKYAIYVTAKGFNVLDSAEQLAKEMVPKLLTELFEHENRNTGTE